MADDALTTARDTVTKLRLRINKLLTAGRPNGNELKALTDALEKAKKDLQDLENETSGIEVMSWDDDEAISPGPITSEY